MKKGVLFIDFEEFKPETYKGLYVSFVDNDTHGQKKTFYSGNFLKDYKDFSKWMKSNRDVSVMYSSSWDGYLMDYDAAIEKILKKLYPGV